jgi:hypothetical protein
MNTPVKPGTHPSVSAGPSIQPPGHVKDQLKPIRKGSSGVKHRQRALADAVAKAARAELAQSKKAKKPDRSGTRVARNRDDLPKTWSR